MQVVITIPKFNAKYVIYLFLLVVWTAFATMAYDGYKWSKSPKKYFQTATAVSSDSQYNTVQFEGEDGNETEVRYTPYAFEKMKVGNKYALEFERGLNVYDFLCIVCLAVVSCAGLIIGVFGIIIPVCMMTYVWTKDLITGNEFTSLKKMWED